MDTHLTSKRNFRFSRVAAVALALVIAAPLGTTSADARAGGGFSFGSRGSRTFSAPPTTMTAPRPASPMQRTEAPNMGATRPGFGANTIGQPRRFGFGTGLAAGLLGAGLLGMLTGNGFFGGLGGIGSLFGLLLQIGLIVLAVRFALNFFRNRRSPAFAGSEPINRSSFGGLGSGLGGFGGGTTRAAPLTVEQADYAAFERILSDVQYAYSREDMTALARMTTPEMLRYFGGELENNRARGVRNEVADTRLIQGDLAEAWREGSAEFATVAMRFSCRDTTVDRRTGRVVSGDPAQPTEATELWTFQRRPGANWLVSAIQQTG